MFIWDDDRIGFLRDASERTGFFSRLTRTIIPYLNGAHTVCDAGAGLGYLSCHLSPYVPHLIPVDADENAISLLRHNIKNKHITNIHPVCGFINEIKPHELYDAMVFCFFGTIEQTLYIAKQQCKGTVVAIKRNRQSHRFSIGTKEHSRSFDHSMKLFDELGIPYQTCEMGIEFGQPFRSLEDADRFFELYVSDRDVTRPSMEEVEQMLIKRKDANFPYYYPRKRELGILIFDAKHIPDSCLSGDPFINDTFYY